ncbi:MAG: PQQ-binding-like beta-propeller repeat protein [Gemmatimonadaceae bacterium]
MRTLSAVTCAAAIVASGCNGPTGSNRNGVEDRWFQAQAGYGQARPAVLEELVFFATGAGDVVARDRGSGSVKWNARVANSQVMGYNFAVTEGVVAVAVAYETVGLDGRTGAILWRYQAPLDSLGPQPPAPGYVRGARIAAASGVVFVPAWGASVAALDARTGATRWTWRSPSGQFRTGAVGVRISEDTAFVGGWDFLDTNGSRSVPWLMALEASSGRLLWRTLLVDYPSGGVSMNGAPALTSRHVIATALGGDTWGLERSSGRIAWYRPPQSKLATVAQAEAWGEVAYIDGGDEFLHALNGSDGQELWRSPFQGGSVVDLLVTERNAYVANGPTLTVFRRQSGQQVAQADAPSRSSVIETFGSAPTADRGQVFVTVSGGAWSFDEP